MSKDTFALIGVIFTAICALGGLCLCATAIADYCYRNMKNIYGLMELKKAVRKYEKEK